LRELVQRTHLAGRAFRCLRPRSDVSLWPASSLSSFSASCVASSAAPIPDACSTRPCGPRSMPPTAGWGSWWAWWTGSPHPSPRPGPSLRCSPRWPTPPSRPAGWNGAPTRPGARSRSASASGAGSSVRWRWRAVLPRSTPGRCRSSQTARRSPWPGARPRCPLPPRSFSMRSRTWRATSSGRTCSTACSRPPSDCSGRARDSVPCSTAPRSASRTSGGSAGKP
jgi:hypothetical protein